MPKLKRVGSVDGGSNCKGCYYHNLDPTHKCAKPSGLQSCCAENRIGKVRWCIFVEDKS